jgi:hypothetical protein
VFVLLFSLIYELFFKRILENNIKRERFFRSKLFVFLLFMLSLSILSAPIIVRVFSYGKLFMGDTPYYHANIINDILAGEIRYSLFSHNAQIYHFILAYLGAFFGVENLSLILPPLMGSIALCLFFILAKKLFRDAKTAAIASLVLLISPAFFYTFLGFSPDIFIMPLMILSVLLLVTDKTPWILLSGAILLMVSMQDPYLALFSLLILLVTTIHIKNNARLRSWLIAILAILCIAYNLFTYAPTFAIPDFRSNLVKESVTDLGGMAGFGVFYLILVASGAIQSWPKKREYSSLYISTLLLFLAALLLDKNYNAYLNLILAYFAAIGLLMMLARKWETSTFKTLTIIILLCGLLFTTLGPDPELVSGLRWLDSQPDGIVLSYHGYSDWISYYSGKTAFITARVQDTPNLLNLSSEIFYSRDLAKTRMLLTNHKIRYIFIDGPMRNGLVWTRENQGLLFLFRNNEAFRQLYKDGSGNEVWEYLLLCNNTLSSNNTQV